MSKIFLVMRGLPPPFKAPKQKREHRPSGIPLMFLFDGGGAEKVVTFLSTFRKRKIVFGPK
jgi:hypothetical protein